MYAVGMIQEDFDGCTISSIFPLPFLVHKSWELMEVPRLYGSSTEAADQVEPPQRTLLSEQD